MSTVPLTELENNLQSDNSAWQHFQTFLEAGGTALDLTRKGVTGAQLLSKSLANTNYVIRDIGKFKLFNIARTNVTLNGLGTTAGGISVFITGMDIKENGLNWDNGTDFVGDDSGKETHILNGKEIAAGTTVFYDLDGNMLGSLPNGSEGITLTFINNVAAFNAALSQHNQTATLEDIDYTAIVSTLRAFGVSYNMDDFLEWNSQNSDDSYFENDFIPIDNKGPLKAEHLSFLRVVDGYVKPEKDVLRGKPNGIDNLPRRPTIHNHVNEGREYIGPAGHGIFGTPENGGMRTDIKNSSWGPGTAAFDILTINNRVYLYNSTGINFTYFKK